MKAVTFLLLSLSLMLASCGGSDDPPAASAPEAEPRAILLGKVHLRSPLVGARIEVQNQQGERIATAAAPSDAAGIFQFTLPSGAPVRVRLVATGGTYEDQPFGERLLLDVDPLGEQSDLYMNAATTLISRYIDRHPGTGVAQATDRVKTFLKIPALSSPGFSVDNPQQDYFRHERLLETMASSGAGGLLPFLDALVTEMDTGVASHSFSREPLVRGIVGDMFSKFTSFLGNALANNGFGLVFNSVMKAIGLDGGAAMLNEINHKLDELHVLTTEVLTQTKDIELQNITLALDKDVRIIQGLYRDMTTLAQSTVPDCASGDIACEELRQARLKDRQDVAKAYMKKILEGVHGSTPVQMKLDEIAGKLDTISLTEAGLLGRASDFLRMSRYFDHAVVDPRLVTIKEYYQTVQAMGTHLLVEALMAQEATGKSPVEQQVFRERMQREAQDAIKLFQDRIARQEARVEELRFKNEHVVLQLRTGLVWLREPNSNLRAVKGSGAYPTFSECKQRADSRFAGLAGWRLPTESELHKLVKGSPNDSGNADGGSGIFNWLNQQGFRLADSSTRTAYFSSTASGLFSHEALWDYGVDWASDFNTPRGAHTPDSVGALCVTSERPKP